MDNFQVVECDKDEADFYAAGLWLKCKDDGDTKKVRSLLKQNAAYSMGSVTCPDCNRPEGRHRLSDWMPIIGSTHEETR